MSTDVPSSAEREARRRQLAVRVMFLVAGVAMAAWAPLVPLAKHRSDLDDAALGATLLALAAGSLVAMPIAGSCAARFGHRLVILVAAACACAALPGLAMVDRMATLAATLFVFGAGLGALDVAMNLEAIAVERDRGRAMMSGFHALFSVGGIAGASGVSLALAIGLDATAIVVVIAASLAVAMACIAPILSGRPRGATSASPLFARPRGIVLAIGAAACATFLVEGAMLDWSAVFLASLRHVDVALAGAGYVAFSIAMTAGRSTGDRIVQRFGGRRVLVAGACGAALGLAIVALVPSRVAAIAGFALVGVGCSNIVPILFTAAGRVTAMPASLSVPAMTTMGYAGLLAGPALIGVVAHATSLVIAFIGLAALMAIVGLAGRTVARE